MPDIDLDFPRDIREKLIVAVTERYGLHGVGERDGPCGDMGGVFSEAMTSDVSGRKSL